MTSRTTDGFWKCYEKLPEQIFSLRITKDYRAVGIDHDKQIIWFWIGSHGDYDKLLKQLRTT